MAPTDSPTRTPLRALVRRGLDLLYTHFAFAYDLVSALVSRGEWRAWTRACIPFIQGTRILEIAHGSGNLHLDLDAAGFKPTGIDLSPQMGALTHKKFRAHSLPLPRLVRARVQTLPFPAASFSTLIMTFPPGFVYDLDAMRELWRVLEPRGTLLWVDAPVIYPRDVWSRFLNWMFLVTGGCANPERDEIGRLVSESHDGALWQMWTWRVERVESKYSAVHVFVGIKNED
ncbi:MAG: methyltransferase domain-containing protein [Anaerolineae bacterium]|nr:methyltransferase domain-containing protein [Anaerolineae bacterium]